MHYRHVHCNQGVPLRLPWWFVLANGSVHEVVSILLECLPLKLPQFPILLVKDHAHLLHVCMQCPHSIKREGCEWQQCDKYSTKERYWNAVQEKSCDKFKVFEQ